MIGRGTWKVVSLLGTWASWGDHCRHRRLIGKNLKEDYKFQSDGCNQQAGFMASLHTAWRKKTARELREDWQWWKRLRYAKRTGRSRCAAYQIQECRRLPDVASSSETLNAPPLTPRVPVVGTSSRSMAPRKMTTTPETEIKM